MTTPHETTADDLTATAPLGTESDHREDVSSAPNVASASEAAAAAEPYQQRSPIDSVLLIDGDNDPHVPPDFKLTRWTLVRVFLRPGALLPRGLEKPLARLPNFSTVVSPKGGANAADFVMSLHAGMLHAVIPHHVPFLMVTNDATLAAMCTELQRLGRLATIWTSHKDLDADLADVEAGTYETEGTPVARNRRGGRSRSGGGRARTSSSSSSSSSSRSRGGRSRGGRGRSSSRSTPSEAAAAPAPVLPPDNGEPRKTGGKTLSEAAWTYASRLQRIKDVPSRVKTLLNDIKNRAGSHGFSPEEILEELKRHHGVGVDGQGRVSVQKVKPAEGAAPEAEATGEDNA